jgi:hypothetical protein
MDICTLATVTALVGHICIGPMACRPSDDGLRQLCTRPVCPSEAPQWECKKPDGTSYTYVEDQPKLLPH